jgi:hypothetical protein
MFIYLSKGVRIWRRKVGGQLRVCRIEQRRNVWSLLRAYGDIGDNLCAAVTDNC